MTDEKRNPIIFEMTIDLEKEEVCGTADNPTTRSPLTRMQMDARSLRLIPSRDVFSLGPKFWWYWRPEILVIHESPSSGPLYGQLRAPEVVIYIMFLSISLRMSFVCPGDAPDRSPNKSDG
jgi:hypothetical protein